VKCRTGVATLCKFLYIELAIAHQRNEMPRFEPLVTG
jgi:hypothetical protein